MSVESDFLSLRFDRRTVLVDDDEPSRFLHHFTGSVVADREDRADLIVGTFEAFYVDVVGVVNEQESLFDVFDTMQATVGYYDLYDDGGDFKPSIVKAACGND